jgi:hypothetical protein
MQLVCRTCSPDDELRSGLREALQREAGVKVRAPFHVAATFEQGWELFSFRAVDQWFNDIRWGYYFSQRLASQAEQLLLMQELDVWRKRQLRKRRQKTTAPD